LNDYREEISAEEGRFTVARYKSIRMVSREQTDRERGLVGAYHMEREPSRKKDDESAGEARKDAVCVASEEMKFSDNPEVSPDSTLSR
jgi:hypothetical protein